AGRGRGPGPRRRGAAVDRAAVGDDARGRDRARRPSRGAHRDLGARREHRPDDARGLLRGSGAVVVAGAGAAARARRRGRPRRLDVEARRHARRRQGRAPRQGTPRRPWRGTAREAPLMARRHGGGGTPATVALDAAGVRYVLHPYEHDPAAASYGMEAAEALGVEPGRVFKTLLVDLEGGPGGCAVGIVPVDRQLDLKAIAAALGAKR